MRSPRATMIITVGALAAPALMIMGLAVAVRGVTRGQRADPGTVPTRPVALVLGAQVFPDGTPSPFLAARLELARRLWVDGRVDRLLLSGDGHAPEYDEPVAMARYLTERGVPAEMITTDPYGLDTYDSCWRARHAYGIDALTVVTQSYHLPRAVAAARLLGLDAVGVGDVSCRRLRRSWRKGVVRELAANGKAVTDLVRQRRPTVGIAV